MRYPEGHKEAVRAKIVAAAARALRRDGLSGVSIPSLMKEVGLTHGGFYGHFRDRDALVSEAIRFAAEQTTPRLFDGPDGLEAALEHYLTPQHAAHPESGCVLAALGTEAGRQPPAVRRTFAEVARGFLRRLEAKLHPGSETLHDDTLATAARMIGAVVLARLVRDDELGGRILAAARATPSPHRAAR